MGKRGLTLAQAWTGLVLCLRVVFLTHLSERVGLEGGQEDSRANENSAVVFGRQTPFPVAVVCLEQPQDRFTTDRIPP